jgi:transcription initiation factor TFIID TATA-box-binding protein
MYYQTSKREQVYLEEQLRILSTQETELETKVDYKIINAVAMGVLTLVEPSIDLTKIEAVIPVKHPNYFPCVMFTVDGVAILIFKNGKIILTAIKDLAVIPTIKGAIEGVLAAAEIKYTNFTIEIQNLVAMTHLKHRINLEMACLTLDNCLYEPEQFPAAIVKKYNGQRGTFLVFGNSKILYLGCNEVSQVDSAMNGFVKELYETGLVEQE